MNKSGFFGEALEMIAEEAGQAKKIAISQVTGKQGQSGKQTQGQKATSQTKTPSDTASSTPAKPIEASGDSKTTDQSTADVVKHLYGQAPSVTDSEKQQKELKDQQNLEALRQRLHGEYYQRLTNPPKQKEEERPAEKVEREKKEERWELEQKEKKKPPPLAVQRERTKAESFRGASG